MKYKITGRNIEVTEALEDAIVNKIKKLDKFFGDNIEAHVTLSVIKQDHILEITIPFSGTILRAEVEGKDMYNIIDDAVAIIEKQVNKFKNRLRSKRYVDHQVFSQAFIEETNGNGKDDVELKIERKKKFAIKPMDPEEAVMQMELLGHNFYVYLNADTEEVNVVYKRKNGTYGLIEPTF